MAIINIRGTGGSGKSTIVREVMSCYPERRHHYQPGRRQPLGYTLERNPVKTPEGLWKARRSLYVVGHYETPCGGCDTIKTPDQVYDLIHSAVEASMDVIYEGIIVQDDTKRLLALNKEHPVLVIGLTTPLDVCVDSILIRRENRGDLRTFNTRNTTTRHIRVLKGIEKLRISGVEVRLLSRFDTLQECRKRFEL